MARSRGAHVIATVRSDADEARRLGAEEVYDAKGVDVIGALRASHPNGVDAVLDLVNGKDAIRGDAEITAHNIASNKNPLSSPQGLNNIARMLAGGAITARIRSTVELDGVGQMLEKLRHGGLRGKAVIRF
jgi:D-arabinose 1-dehydrogenase-like Zn-dependent alcohol dehydrogenase